MSGGASTLVSCGRNHEHSGPDELAGNRPSDVAIMDLDQDTLPDLVVGIVSETGLGGGVVLKGQGGGVFAEPGVAHPVPPLPHSFVTRDFNLDGRPDLACLSFTRVSILFGAGDGTFSEVHHYAAGTHPLSLEAGDFNND